MKTTSEKMYNNHKFAAKVMVAAKKIANISFGTAGAAGTVMVGTNYYASNKKHVSRAEKKQIKKVNKAAASIGICSFGIGSVATVVSNIAAPLPFDEDKYNALIEAEEAEASQQVAEAEEAVDAKIAPEATEETQEGAEQNAQ